MPKIYDQKLDRDRDMKERATLSSSAPERSQNRNTLLIVAIVLGVMLVILFYRMASGEVFGALTSGEPLTITTTSLS